MITQQVSQALSQYLLAASIKKIDGAYADLEVENTGEHLRWPIAHLPSYITPGMSVSIQIGNPDQIKQERDAIVHQVLQELIH